jgi:hypothetical protein
MGRGGARLADPAVLAREAQAVSRTAAEAAGPGLSAGALAGGTAMAGMGVEHLRRGRRRQGGTEPVTH